MAHRSTTACLAATLAAVALAAGCGGDTNDAVATAPPPETALASPAPTLAEAAATVTRLLDGVAQRDLRLGAADAPVEIIEYAGTDCSPCAALHRTVIPRLIDRYVRAGEVSIELRPLTAGDRSLALALAAFGAAPQDRAWHVIQLAFLRSDVDTSAAGPAEAYARSFGIDLGRWRTDRNRTEWATDLRAALDVFKVAKWSGAPVLLVRRAGSNGPFVVLTQPATLTEVEDAIDEARTAPA